MTRHDRQFILRLSVVLFLLFGIGWQIYEGVVAAQGPSATPHGMNAGDLTALPILLLPPAVFLWSLATGASGTLFWWSALTTGFGVAFWCLASTVMKSSPLYGLLYPVGSIVSAFIFVKSWMAGSRIRWKDRVYEMSAEARRGGG